MFLPGKVKLTVDRLTCGCCKKAVDISDTGYDFEPEIASEASGG